MAFDYVKLIHKHFLPDNAKYLDESFYTDVKTEKAQKIIKQILKEIENVE